MKSATSSGTSSGVTRPPQADRHYAFAIDQTAVTQPPSRLEQIITLALRATSLALKGDTEALQSYLSEADPEFVGFAVEGAAMGLTMRQNRKPADPPLIESLWDGPFGSYRALIYAGIGVGIRECGLDVASYVNGRDDLMVAFVVDGYGFNYGFAAADEYLGGQPRPAGVEGDFGRIFDVGLARSLWFNSAAEPELVVKGLAAFADDRLHDLLAGVGFAATYAGGLDAEGLGRLLDAAVDHRSGLAVGAVLAAHVRASAGNATSASGRVCEVLSGRSAESADELCAAARLTVEEADGASGLSGFLAWRTAVSAEL